MNGRATRALTRGLISKAFKTLRQAKAGLKQLGVDVSLSTIQRAAKSSNLQYRKCRKVPPLTKAHRRRRLQWAKEMLNNPPDWRQVIFTDEKKWSVCGPDGSTRAWCHKYASQLTRSYARRLQGVVVWGGISVAHQIQLLKVPRKMNSAAYCKILRDGLPKERGVTILQDNAPVHVSRATRMELDRMGVRVVQLPPNSPDLNPIENVWGILTARVYAAQPFYTNVESLLAAVRQEWDILLNDAPLLQRLSSSMTTRCKEVVKLRGGFPSGK